MPITVIPANKNVGKSLDDINANFAYLDRESADKSGAFENSTASKVWVILHNLNKKPSVNVIDNYGDVVWCDIEYTNDNTVTLRFSEATAGTVYFN